MVNKNARKLKYNLRVYIKDLHQKSSVFCLIRYYYVNIRDKKVMIIFTKLKLSRN